MKKSSAISAASLAALLLTGAVGCGKSDGKSPEMSPAAAVAAASKNADAITSLRYRVRGTVAGEGKMHGEAAMNLKPLAMSMKMSVEGGEDAGDVEIRLVDKALFFNGGEDAAKELDGKTWVKFDMSKSTKELEELGAAGQAQQNPAAESTFLAGSKDVKKVGTEKIDGVSTTHYAGTVTPADIKASLAGQDEAGRKEREESLKSYEELGVDRLTMDMWIDGEQHTKQFRMRGDADKGPLDMTVTFLDVNKPVTVTAPPAKDVADLAEMMKKAMEEAMRS
ncbi:DUF1396 domain-containing protein [Streptomyces sp. Ru71]|uniref:LppX_LprAFG lipoprotein n=1 Tax=Streptomyces sp. Ru71 TaxID=2080746 RepID=UPI000CDD9EBD|nr:LppX_LprAFG lipoprotein [Streptomyces sp. Ru71]POX55389.1 DUF1396 domain-containing protein [Streptomyces sp. Ru71]